ncbi:MAG: TonB-dependent receptor plug domain-containing protein, partial [Endomicrobiales bacterium]
DEYLPLENVKRIEFIKGPGSALYGTNAFVGVINVITKSADDINGTEVSGGFGTQDTTVASIITGSADDPSKTVAFGRVYNTRGLGMEFANNGRRNSTQSDPVAASTFWLKSSPFKGFTFSGEYIEFRHTQASNWDLPSEQWNRNEYTFKDFLIDLRYEKELSDSVNGMVKAWWHDFDDYSFYEQNASSLTVQMTNYDIYPIKKSQTVGAQVEFGMKLPANNEAVAGAQFDWEDIQKVVDLSINRVNGLQLLPPSFWMDPVSDTNYAFYAEDIYKPLKWMDITLGVRNDNHEVFGSFVSPRGGVVMRPTDRSVAKLLYGEAYRAPAYREMYVFTNAYSSGNLGLKPERIKTAEIELDYFLTGNLKTQVNYYQNKITDRIDQEKIGANYHWTNFSGEASVQGLEYLLNYSQGNTNAFLNASWNDAKDSDGKIIPSIPLYMANVGATYSFNELLSISPVVMWVGYRPRTPDDTNSGGFDPRYPRGVIRPDLPQYTVVNLPVTYKVNNLELVLAVYNLFDTAYYVQPSNTKWNDYEQPRRTLTARVYYKF